MMNALHVSYLLRLVELDIITVMIRDVLVLYIRASNWRNRTDLVFTQPLLRLSGPRVPSDFE